MKAIDVEGKRMWENSNGERFLEPFADIKPNIVHPSPTHIYIQNPRWFIFGFIIGIGIGTFISVLL